MHISCVVLAVAASVLSLAHAGSGPYIPRAIVLNACNAPRNQDRQVFSFKNGVIALAQTTADGLNLCVTAPVNVPGPMIAFPCLGNSPAQEFAIDQGKIVSTAYSGNPIVSVPAPVGGPYYIGIQATFNRPGTVSNASATFNLNFTGTNLGKLVHVSSGLCLDAGPMPNAHACLDPALRYTTGFCNQSLPISARVADLLGRLTVEEKVNLTGSGPWSDSCDTIDYGVPRLSIPPHQWLVETNSMIASSCYGQQCATSFPSGLNLAASFNRSLWMA